jgi:outer membrane lipoprotein-sorting protein
VTSRALAVIAVGILGYVAGVQSQGAAVDPRARSALEQMQAAYKALDALHIKVKWTAKYSGAMSRDDFPLPGPDELELRLQRPNKFYLSATTKGSGRPSQYLIVSDGGSVWHWQSWTNTYTQRNAPATLSEMARVLPEDVIGASDGTTWEAQSIMEWDLLVGDVPPTEKLAESGMSISLGAPEKVGAASVDVVRLSAAASPLMPMSSEVTYLLDVTSHLIRGYNLTTRGKHPDNGKDFNVTMRAAYDLHVTQPRFTAADFVFTPPKGAKQVDARR